MMCMRIALLIKISKMSYLIILKKKTGRNGKNIQDSDPDLDPCVSL